MHLDIIDGKVWVQFDGTDRPIADEPVRAGISKEDIVLAEKPPEVRAHTGYGVRLTTIVSRTPAPPIAA